MSQSINHSLFQRDVPLSSTYLCAFNPPKYDIPGGIAASRMLKHAKATTFTSLGQLWNIFCSSTSSITVWNDISSSLSCGYTLFSPPSTPPPNTSRNDPYWICRHALMFSRSSFSPDCCISALNPSDASPIASSGPSGFALSMLLVRDRSAWTSGLFAQPLNSAVYPLSVHLELSVNRNFVSFVQVSRIATSMLSSTSSNPRSDSVSRLAPIFLIMFTVVSASGLLSKDSDRCRSVGISPIACTASSPRSQQSVSFKRCSLRQYNAIVLIASVSSEQSKLESRKLVKFGPYFSNSFLNISVETRLHASSCNSCRSKSRLMSNSISSFFNCPAYRRFKCRSWGIDMKIWRKSELFSPAAS